MSYEEREGNQATRTDPRADAIEGFTLVRRLARSNATASWLGVDEVTHRAVIVDLGIGKLDTQALALFTAECTAVKALRGDLTASVPFASGLTSRGRSYLVQHAHEGGSLRDHLATEKSISLSQALLVGRTIGTALQAAHVREIVHHHVHPAVIVLDRAGVPALGGFCHYASQLEGVGSAGALRVLGVDHAAPEVLAGGRPTTASDVYGLASTLYQCVAGRAPFKRSGHTIDTQLRRKLSEEAPRLTLPPAAKGTVTEPPEPEFEALANVLADGLHRNPAERPTIADFLSQLDVLGADAGVLWGPEVATAPHLQNEVDDVLNAEMGEVASRPAPPQPSRPAQVIRPIPSTAGPVGRRDRDHVLRALTADAHRDRRRKFALWGGTAAAALILGFLAFSGPPGADQPIGALLTVATTVASDVRVESRPGRLPAPGSPDVVSPANAVTTTGLPQVVEAGVAAAPAVAESTAQVGPVGLVTPAATTVPTLVLPSNPPTTRPAPTTTTVRATNPPTTVAVTPPPPAEPQPATTPAPPPPGTSPATTTTLAPATTPPPATTTTSTSTTTTTTTTTTTVAGGGSRPYINGISASPNGDGSVSLSADAEKCAAYSWSVQSSDGATSINTGLRYPNGNCFKSSPSYSSDALPAGSYTVTLRLKSTSSGRENSSSASFSI